MKADNSPARGMRDLLPQEVATRDHVLSAITEIYRSFGYRRIETPALEDITRLQGGQGGENEKLIYQVLRRGLPPQVDAGPVADLVDLGLRFDLTVPLTRFYGNNHAQLPTPFRSLQIGPVWRAERPQKGRYRQFYQCDIDMIGEPTVLAEAELIEATTAALDAVGLDNMTVRLSDRRFLSALADDAKLPEASRDRFFITLDKLDKIGWEGVRGELADLGLPQLAISRALDVIDRLQDVEAGKLVDTLADALPGVPEHVLEDLAATTGSLDSLSLVRSVEWRFDPTLVRGMGYYTGQIFEISHAGMSSSVAGGGRYDKLIGRTLGKDVPACGFSIGFERIIGLVGRRDTRDTLAVLYDSDVSVADALAVAREIRSAGRHVEVIPRSGKLGAQLKRLEGADFGSFVSVRQESGATVRDDERALRGPTGE
ncbi:histidine--tRNA ligase [Nocardia kruczakiae]|uniref:histidine--tRNA ligase n=1 Tax=Nocardia kruczakiae TaxID=261477 RepID=UPI0007A533EE|nr:histidine--tRNA ligase [Nocardia kruczakiae]